MQSKATTVAAYLRELPPDRRAVIQAVREVILANLDKDYEEGMQYGGIGYYVPHRVFPAGYHCDPSQPLNFAGIASQKNHLSLGLMCVYFSSEHAEWFRTAWTATGRKLDMGKCCIRFKKIEDVALDVVGEAVRRVPAAKYVASYLQILESRGKPATSKRPTKKAATKSSTKQPTSTAAAKSGRAPRAKKSAAAKVKKR